MQTEEEPIPENRKPYESAFFSSVPTGWTRHLRVNPFWQLWRFMIINLKMMRIISLSHSND